MAKSILWWLLGAALFVFAFTGNLETDFVRDDLYLIRRNPSMMDPSGWLHILRSDLWGDAGQPLSQLYHPIPQLTIWIQARVHGVSAMMPFRIVNALLHLGCSALFWILLGRWRIRHELRVAATLIMLVHPSTTEPVMWIIGRHDTVGTLFILLGLLWMPEQVRQTERVTLGMMAMAAFLTKEAFVVAPLLFLANGLRRATDTGGPTIKQSCAGPMTSCLFLLPVFGARRLVGIREGADQVHASLIEHLNNYGTILWHYLVQISLLRNGRTTHWFEPWLGGVFLLFACLGVLVIAAYNGHRARDLTRRRQWSLTAFGIGWFMIVYLPHTMSIPTIQMYGNRYAYLGGLGLALAMASALELTLSSFRTWEKSRRDPWPENNRRWRIGAAGFITVLCLLAAVTRFEADNWRSAFTLYQADMHDNRLDPMACYHFATAAHGASGMRRCSQGERRILQRSVRLNPRFARAWHNLASCYRLEQDFTRALEPARQAFLLEPNDPRREYRFGEALLRTGDRQRAIRHLEHAHRFADPTLRATIWPLLLDARRTVSQARPAHEN